MAQISIDRVISVSLQAALAGLANANTSALALISDELPLQGAAAYGAFGIYYGPGGVAADFGSGSKTYALAVAVFSQNPNILSAGGYLIIIPRVASNPVQPAVMLSAGPVDLTQLTGASYTINLAIGVGAAADVVIGPIYNTPGMTLAQIQTALNSTAITTAGVSFSLSGTPNAAFVTLTTTATGATAKIIVGASVSTGINAAPLLQLSGTVIGTAAGLEAIRDAVLRTYFSVFYFGVIFTTLPTDAELPALAGLIQSIDKFMFYGEFDSTKVAGIMATLTASGFTQSRGLLYVGTGTIPAATAYAAAYASRALSTVFSGSNTVGTMHLKQLVGITADPGLTETIVTAAQSAGVDVYADFGVPKLFTSGANGYFDAVYIALAFKLGIRVAGFNYMATTNTKIPQTEEGMNGLKSALRIIIKQFVANGAFAPGAWLESTFGDPADFIRNISDNGYYIFSTPIASQSLTQRTARQAPLIQIACKSAGAIHSANVILNIEA
jgi:hypothetical protein